MKRILFPIAIVLLIALMPLGLAQVSTSTVMPVMLSAPQSRWAELGTITAVQAYPGVNDRDYTTVLALPDPNTFVWELDNVARKVQMSFQTTADGDSTTIILMGFADSKSLDLTGSASLDDDAVYLGTLELTGGKQIGKHSNVYVDTISATDGVCVFSELDSAADRRCVVEFTSKYKVIVGIATTLQGSSTLYAEGRLCP